MKMAKILQLCVRYPPAPGGAETHVKSLKGELERSGHTVDVFTSDLYKEFPFTKLEERSNRADVKRHSAYTLPGDLHYVFYPSLVRSIIEKDYDIYHAHSYGYFHVNVAAFFKHLKDTPLVLTPHYHPEWSMWGGKKRKFVRGIYDSLVAQKVIDSTDKVIGVSKNEINLLGDRLDVPKEKIETIPNGISPEKFDPVPDGEVFRKEYDIEENIVLYTGRLATNKGLLDLVEAVPKVLEDFPETTFVLVGEDEGMGKKIKRKAHRLDVEDSVLLTGYIKDYDLFKSAYSAADVYVLPSEYEAFGIVLLEAMMCETPCIGTKVGGIPEVIEDGETGYIIEHGDTRALEEKLKRLLDDRRLRDKMGTKGRKRVLENFTWKKVAEEVQNVYAELI